MSVILQPQVAFPIVRQIADHTDATTYYVRAVVRDADGSTIDTVNLTSQGNQRYQTSWRVPADPSGRGRYISIITSVYTDSGYTTKSPNYGDEENTYLIFDRVMPAMRGGGGGVDARTVRRIIKEEIAKIPEPEPVKIPKQKEYEMRWDDILSAVQELRTQIDAIPRETTDISPLYPRFEALEQAIQQKPVTPQTDLEPVAEMIREVLREQDFTREDIRELVMELENKLPDIVDQNAGKAMGRAKFNLNMPFGMNMDGMREPQPEPEEELDLNNLAL